MVVLVHCPCESGPEVPDGHVGATDVELTHSPLCKVVPDGHVADTVVVHCPLEFGPVVPDGHVAGVDVTHSPPCNVEPDGHVAGVELTHSPLWNEEPEGQALPSTHCPFWNVVPVGQLGPPPLVCAFAKLGDNKGRVVRQVPMRNTARKIALAVINLSFRFIYYCSSVSCLPGYR